jgi:hypothetical protein
VNAGHRANERVCATGQPQELISSNERHVAIEWLRAGFPIETVEQAIYARSLSYTPKHTRRQPHGLSYFAQAIREAVDRSAVRGVERPIAAAKHQEDVDWGELERQERAR